MREASTASAQEWRRKYRIAGKVGAPRTQSVEDVRLIRELREGGMPYAALSEKFELVESSLNDICNYRSYVDVR